jgi:acyl dehydratase
MTPTPLLYLKAAAPLIPLASRLPGIPGSGTDVPERELVRTGVRVDLDALTAYSRVCGFPLRSELPATYPHVLAFGLHMELMSSGDFPFGAVGLVHVANRITQHRPLDAGEELELRVRATPLQPHPRGRTFEVLTSVLVDGDEAWSGRSTFLRRGGGSGDAPATAAPQEREAPPRASAFWRLGGDLGRRYGAASGDRNPIHLHSLTAKAFGFPRAIAHGMWTKARCVAALEPGLGDRFTVDVSFKQPILLPATVGFGTDGERFAVTARDGGRLHLQGRVT